MGKIRRRFDAKFKQEICQAVISGQQDIREICQDHQIQRATVDRWIMKFQQGGPIGASVSKREDAGKPSREASRQDWADGGGDRSFENFHEMLRQRRSVDASIVIGKNLAQFQNLARE